MQVTLWPFWSQQDKRTGEFLQTCGNVKQLVALGEELRRRGHKAQLVTPQLVKMLPNNPVQRVHWDCEQIDRLTYGSDVLVTNHEYLAIPARVVAPRLKIVQMCNVAPDDPLFTAAFNAADMVVAQGNYARQCMQQMTRTPVVTWPLAYDEDNFGRAPALRDIDVLFLQRCSANNCTHHEEFLRQMKPYWKVVFTDVTNFLKRSRPDLAYSTPATYYDVLHRSKVVVSMHNSWYGGISIREACRAGCTPVVLRNSAYAELVGYDWPYFTDTTDIAETVDRALTAPRTVRVDESYQKWAPHAAETLRWLSSR